MNVREEAVAGAFYPKKENALMQQIGSFLKEVKGREQGKAGCVIAPHAGYTYSGATAAHSFKALAEAECFAIISPNHTGMGKRVSVSNADAWKTPLGNVPVDIEKREALLERLGIEADGAAHIQEHSVEVQIPWLQFLFKGFKVLPVTLATQDLGEMKEVGNALSEMQGISVIASSDFTHFEPEESAREKDMKAISRIREIDLEGFHQTVTENRMSICGHAAITAGMQYCRKTGCREGTLLKYDTSASTSGNKASVVGYAAIKFR